MTDSASLTRSVAALFKRFTELTAEEQLSAYRSFRDYLVAGKQTVDVDPELDERSEALRLMRNVLEHHGLSDPSDFKEKQFDEAPERVREGWSGRRVAAAFGGWKMARHHLAGIRPKETAQQRAIRRHAKLNKLRAEDYWTAIREWLATNPPGESSLHYIEWRREKNAVLKPGEMPAPTIEALRRNHHITWSDALLIAKGKLTLKQAKKTKAERRAAISSGEHDLVSRGDISEMWGKAESSVAYEAHKPDFPTAVIVIEKRRLYLRDDVAAYIAGGTFPTRTENGLRPLYLTYDEASKQAASRLGLAPRTMKERLPTPTVRVGGMKLWLKTEFQTWLAKEAQARKNGAVGSR